MAGESEGDKMITVRRKRKRNLNNPSGRYRAWAAAVLVVALMGLCAFGLIGRFRYADRLDDLGDFMAKAIRTDLNQALQSYDTIQRRGDDSALDALTNMKRYMYAAYRLNLSLVDARGERYSIIDTATYNSFQTIVGEYERLLANGQSTASVKTSLGNYMSAIENTLSTRFDSADLLLPQTASKKTGR